LFQITKVSIMLLLPPATHVKFDVHVTVHRVKFLVIKPTRCRIRMALLYHPDPARKLSAKPYDIYYCCVYSEKLLTMDRGTLRNMWNFIPRINLMN
jgi:hypothetical protein